MELESNGFTMTRDDEFSNPLTLAVESSSYGASRGLLVVEPLVMRNWQLEASE